MPTTIVIRIVSRFVNSIFELDLTCIKFPTKSLANKVPLASAIPAVELIIASKIPAIATPPNQSGKYPKKKVGSA